MAIKIQTKFKDYCEGEIALPTGLIDAWLIGDEINAHLSIVAYLWNTGEPQGEEVLAANKIILEEELGADVQIICANGKRVQCNSGNLIGNFIRMF